MKILILEDASERISQFKDILKGHDLYFFDNVSEATAAYDLLGPWDALFIDHDLDDRIYVDSSEENTGYQFAKNIEEKLLPETVIVHSMNPVGCENIKSIISKASIIPFPNLIKLLTKGL